MKHLILFFISIVSLSQAANLVRAAHAPALMIGFWRLLGAGLLMLAFRYWKTRGSNNFFEPASKSTWLWTALSSGFFFLHLWTFFYSAQSTSIANCMVIFATNPVFTALGAWLFLRDRFEKRYAVAFIFAFTGVAFLVSDRLSWELTRAGDFAALASAVFFSFYLVAGKKARLTMSTDQFTWIIYSFACLLFLFAGSLQSIQWTGYPLFTWWAILGNILIPTLLGHVLFTHLLKFFNINWLSCGKLIEPALSSLVAFLAFGETLRTQTIVAFGFTVLAVMILFWPLLRVQSPIPEKNL